MSRIGANDTNETENPLNSRHSDDSWDSRSVSARKGEVSIPELREAPSQRPDLWYNPPADTGD